MLAMVSIEKEQFSLDWKQGLFDVLGGFELTICRRCGMLVEFG